MDNKHYSEPLGLMQSMNKPHSYLIAESCLRLSDSTIADVLFFCCFFSEKIKQFQLSEVSFRRDSHRVFIKMSYTI